MKDLNRFNVRQGFHRMGSRYGRLFDKGQFLNRDIWDNNRLTPDSHPYSNIKAKEDCYIIEVATPGFKKTDLSLKVSNDVLIVMAQKKSEEDNSSKYIQQEYDVDVLKRVFMLSPEVDTDNIQAHYEDGVLKMELYYRPEVKNDKTIHEINID